MPDNIASLRVMQKLGFEPAGPLTQWEMVMISYRLRREQWRRTTIGYDRT